MMSRRRRREENERGIDLTPMLDVVFILLIFFIVTASFAREAGLDVSRPDRSAPPPEPGRSRPIVISIDAEGQVSLQSRRIDVASVTSNVARGLTEDPNRPVLLRVSPRAQNGIFVRVLDRVRLAGGPDATTPIPVSVVQPAE